MTKINNTFDSKKKPQKNLSFPNCLKKPCRCRVLAKIRIERLSDKERGLCASGGISQGSLSKFSTNRALSLGPDGPILPLHYLGAAVEVVGRGGVHEALLQVHAGVNAAGQHQLARGVDHLCPAGDHQLLAHLLDDAILNVDVGLLGAVVVHHFATFDQDARHGRAGRHGYRSARRKGGERDLGKYFQVET